MKATDKLYTKDGWIDAGLLVHNKAPFVLAIGGRGIGKTYGVLKMLYEEKTPFLYVRRTMAQLEAVTIPALSPYNQINTDCGYNVGVKKLSKHTVSFYDDKTEFAVGIALSTFASIRGMSAEKFEVLLFDEIIPERHEKKMKEEDTAFANMLESLNRNRELNGKPPLKVILLSNSNTINSKIISVLGVTDIVETMERRKECYRVINNDVCIVRYEDSPISKRKSNTALYRVVNNADFKAMAIENEFAAADYERVKRLPLQEYNMIVSIGDCTICKHKSKNEYYIISGAKASLRYNILPLEKASFQKKYSYIYKALLRNRVYFQSASCKLEFERGFDL